MKNVKMFDRLRKASSPLEVDLVESYAKGRLSRRQFLQRGSVIGLSVPFMGAVIAACGSDEKSGSGSSGGAGTTAAGSPDTGATATTAGGPAKAGGTLKVANPKPSGPVDPVAMENLGAYTIASIPLEYLCGPGEGAELAPMLAESWSPNDDGSVWTFVLRKGVMWHDGSPFTSADVVATLDRLAEAGLKASIAKGAAVAKDDLTVEITLLAPDGQFPYQVSNWNPQSLITPADYAAGTTISDRPVGTGPFKLVSYDDATGVKYERNDAWWGGTPSLDGVEIVFSDTPEAQIQGLLGGAVDAVVQFPVIGGDAVFAQSDKYVIDSIQGSSHRQIWMNTREGNFVDKRTRQAIAYALDREAIIETVLRGKGDMGNDHPIAPLYEYWDSAQPQRTRDVEKAKQLLKDSGKEGLEITLNVVDLQEISKTAELVKTQLEEIGMKISLNVKSPANGIYDTWCKVYDSTNEPAGCDGGEEFGIVDYGNRATPDVFLTKAYATGEWNSAHFVNEELNTAVAAYQAALDTDGRAEAIKKVQEIATEEVPYAIPYFVNSLTAYSTKVTGVQQTGLGHYYLGKAGFVE
jgi:peptide/nickel transport system substrate-binding protein